MNTEQIFMTLLFIIFAGALFMSHPPKREPEESEEERQEKKEIFKLLKHLQLNRITEDREAAKKSKAKKWRRSIGKMRSIRRNKIK